MSHIQRLLQEHPDWIAPRSDQHTVIGIPNSSEHRKTFVEPGGSFSPGVGSYGVTVWVYDRINGILYAPEELPSEQLEWHWEQGYIPVLHSSWSAGNVMMKQSLLAAELDSLQSIVNSQQVTVHNSGSVEAEVTVYLVIRSQGAAGGRLREVSSADHRSVSVNGKVAVLAKTEADEFGAASYEQDRGDISVFLASGQLPPRREARDTSPWNDVIGLIGGALAYHLRLAPQESRTYAFDYFVHPVEHDYLAKFASYHQSPFLLKQERVISFWKEQLHQIELQTPDKRFTHAFYSTIAQMLMATVDNDPRIATVTYPMYWIRDGVYITNALDKAGFHAVARRQLENLKSRLFAGGFGCEPDAFGEAIWPFYTHYTLTADIKWLSEVYQSVRMRAEWIMEARSTQDYLYRDLEMRVPDQRYAADTDVICEPARDGLIQGRMDWHRPIIWINAYSYLGLRAAARMAKALGFVADEHKYLKEAEQLQRAIHAYGETAFGDNDRDTVCAIWPTEAFSVHSVTVLEKYESQWQSKRLQGKGEYAAEPLWKYFELGQAHNYLYIGDREKVWLTLDHYLDHHDVSGLYGWLEDSSDISEYWSRIEGWYKQPSRQPHGWVSSELFLLLRDMLLYEKDQTLVVGEGIRLDWLHSTMPISVKHAPTAFGPVDVLIRADEHRNWHIQICFHEQERLPECIELRLPWQQEELHTSIGLQLADECRVERSRYLLNGKVDITINQQEDLSC